MSVAFAAHSSREIQAAAAPSRAGGGGDDEEGEQEELIDDPMAQPEFATGGGDLAHHQAGVTDRVRLLLYPRQDIRLDYPLTSSALFLSLSGLREVYNRAALTLSRMWLFAPEHDPHGGAQVVFALSRARRERLVDRTLGCRVHLFSSEADLLRAALEYVKQQDPDALVLFQVIRSPSTGTAKQRFTSMLTAPSTATAHESPRFSLDFYRPIRYMRDMRTIAWCRGAPRHYTVT